MPKVESLRMQMDSGVARGGHGASTGFDQIANTCRDCIEELIHERDEIVIEVVLSLKDQCLPVP